MCVYIHICIAYVQTQHTCNIYECVYVLGVGGWVIIPKYFHFRFLDAKNMTFDLPVLC